MTGCRHGAKNTLDKNYLFLARKRGMQLLADTKVEHVGPLPDGGYRVRATSGRSPVRAFRRTRTFTARNVVFSAGALGTTDLLLALQSDPAGLPRLSPRLGERVRTNSESLIGVISPGGEDLSRGVAIGSIYEPDAVSHLEVVRYGRGSGAFRPLQAPHVDADLPAWWKPFAALGSMLAHPLRTFRAYFVGDWASRTTILLYMRTLEGTLRFRRRRGVLGRRMRTELEGGERPVASIPEATRLAREFAAHNDGYLGSMFTETLLDIPTTAHLLGGCTMGDSRETGVIDHAHRVFGYDGLFVVDGSAISANPGVNPSLTITALAERAMSFVPAKAAIA
jgi:cholesterol oxidase